VRDSEKEDHAKEYKAVDAYYEFESSLGQGFKVSTFQHQATLGQQQRRAL
jgi:hypothetical protein